MSRDEFTTKIRGNEGLQGRFVADPEAVLREYGVDMELTDAELDAVVGGVGNQAAFVHQLLTMVVHLEADGSGDFSLVPSPPILSGCKNGLP